MFTMQKKIVAAITAIVEANGCDVTFQPQFSNTGTAFVAPRESFKNELSFWYSFQSHTFEINIFDGLYTPTAGMVSPSDPGLIKTALVNYTDAKSLDAIFDLFKSRLKKFQLQKPRKRTKKSKDNISKIVNSLVDKVRVDGPTNLRGACRDILTELIFILQKAELDPSEVFEAAKEVAEQETELQVR